MYNKRRTDLEIKRDILKTISTKAGITKIVYNANLNFHIVKRHLKPLIDKGYVMFDNKTYTLTDKGVEIIPVLDQTILLI